MFSHDSRLHRAPRLGMRGTSKDLSGASHYKIFFLSRADESTGAAAEDGGERGEAAVSAEIDGAVAVNFGDAEPTFKARRSRRTSQCERVRRRSTHFTTTADV